MQFHNPFANEAQNLGREWIIHRAAYLLKTVPFQRGSHDFQEEIRRVLPMTDGEFHTAQQRAQDPRLSVPRISTSETQQHLIDSTMWNLRKILHHSLSTPSPSPAQAIDMDNACQRASHVLGMDYSALVQTTNALHDQEKLDHLRNSPEVFFPSTILPAHLLTQASVQIPALPIAHALLQHPDALNPALHGSSVSIPHAQIFAELSTNNERAFFSHDDLLQQGLWIGDFQPQPASHSPRHFERMEAFKQQHNFSMLQIQNAQTYDSRYPQTISSRTSRTR